MHVPHGLAVWVFALLPILFPRHAQQLQSVSLALPWIWSLAFLVYELNTDRHKQDGAYLDIYGFLEGIVIGAVCVTILMS
jgi:hypothetical protein